MKILNLYAGVGGNRKLWGDEHEITAVEIDAGIAKVYQDFFPKDKVVVADAHQFLLDNFQRFDFIWSSPPCPTHPKANNSLQGYGIFRYPDMNLYQEIIFLKHFFKGKWTVENVVGYYPPLIKPEITLDRHFFWSNFEIPQKEMRREHNVNRATKETLAEFHQIFLPQGTKDQRKLLRNCVRPEIGLHILRQITPNF